MLARGRTQGPASFLVGVTLDELVQEIAADEQRLDAHVLIESVNVAEIRPDEDRHDAVGRNAVPN